MIQYSNTMIVKTAEGDHVPGEQINDEGMALVFKNVDGKNLLGLSTGAADEVFAGFSINTAMPVGQLPAIDKGTVTNGAFAMGHTPDPSNFLIKLDGSVVASGDISTGSTAPTGSGNEGKVVIDRDRLLFHTDVEGQSVYIQYTYEPSASEASLYHGDGPIGGSPGAALGRTGRLISCTRLSISNFDASVDWSGAMHPSLGANGTVTVGGTGTKLTNWVVVSAPVAGNAFLTLESVQ